MRKARKSNLSLMEKFMPIATSTTLIQRFADALFGVQVGSTLLAQVLNDRSTPGTDGLKPQFNDYFTQAFGASSSAAVADVMLGNLNIVAGKYGLDINSVKVARDYITANLNAAPATMRGETISKILTLWAGMGSDATYGAAATAFNNEIAGAEVWSASNTANAPHGTANTYNLQVGVDNMTGTAGNDLFVANVVQNSNGQQVNTLGSGDFLNGNGGLDTLSAKITAGAYVNGATTNSTNSQLAGNTTQGSSSMPLQPETHGIQTVKLQAVNSNISGSNMTNGNGAASTEVFVNAKNMTDVTKISSDNSDANLTIQNLTTLNADGSRHALNTDTVGMAFTGNSDTGWKESDLHVYFDQDYLTPTVTSSASVDIRVMNQDSYDTSNSQATALGVTSSTAAIGQTYLYQLSIVLNGKNYNLAPYLTVAASASNSLINYAGELAAIKAAIVQLKAANPTDAVLQTLSANLGSTFTADAPVDPISGIIGAPRQGTSVTLTVAGGATANILTIDTLLLAPVSQTNANMNLFNRSVITSPTSTANLAINVDLTKVGNWGDGGSLVIGSMYKDGLNTWSDQYAGKGINEFDVTVRGTKIANGDDQSSSLKQMASTGNNLKIVKVVSDSAVTANFADLTIGNSQTESAAGALTPLTSTPSANNLNALKDVQIFDASGFKGNLNLFAGLSSEVTAKYLNVGDGAPAAPAADNVAFVYTGGSGNDSINLFLDPSNLAKPGTATREDMTLVVNGGAGDDAITLKIGDGAVVAATGVSFANVAFPGGTFATIGGLTGTVETGSVLNWYANQKINAGLSLVNGVATGQIVLNGGDGNDTLRKMGSGDVAFNGGSGNNTIYAENTGNDGNAFNAGRAVDVFNAKLNTAGIYDPTNLLSDNRSLTVAANTTVAVTVSVLGFEKTVSVINAVGTTVITDLMINQAVKAAVNLDPVLSKLVAAADGPAHTLVLSWLIDGNMNIDPTTGLAAAGISSGSLRDLSISLTSTTVTSAQLDTAFGTTAGVYANHAGTNAAGTVTMTGQNSINPSDNLIDANSNLVGGTDVIVLGTAGFHQSGDQMLGSNDTVAYQGFGGVNDTIVNFDTTMSPARNVDTAPNTEVATLTFSASDGTPNNETIIFDGVTVTLSAPSSMGVIPAIDVASQFVAQYGAGPNWSATLAAPGSNQVVLTHFGAGAVTDLIGSGSTGTNFSGNYFGPAATTGGGTVSVVTTTQGQNIPVHSSFVVNLDPANTAAVANGAFTFNGTSVSYVSGDGSLTLAAKLGAGAYANWTAVDNANSTVTFTAKAAGATVLPLATDFVGIDATATDGIVGSFSIRTLGDGTSTTIAAGQGQSFDYLDFTAYRVGSVHVNGATVTGAAATNYVDLAESATNAGFYAVTVHAADNSLVGTVGTIDFGHHEAFVAQNFII